MSARHVLRIWLEDFGVGSDPRKCTAAREVQLEEFMQSLGDLSKICSEDAKQLYARNVNEIDN